MSFNRARRVLEQKVRVDFVDIIDASSLMHEIQAQRIVTAKKFDFRPEANGRPRRKRKRDRVKAFVQRLVPALPMKRSLPDGEPGAGAEAGAPSKESATTKLGAVAQQVAYGGSASDPLIGDWSDADDFTDLSDEGYTSDDEYPGGLRVPAADPPPAAAHAWGTYLSGVARGEREALEDEAAAAFEEAHLTMEEAEGIIIPTYVRPPQPQVRQQQRTTEPLAETARNGAAAPSARPAAELQVQAADEVQEAEPARKEASRERPPLVLAEGSMAGGEAVTAEELAGVAAIRASIRGLHGPAAGAVAGVAGGEGEGITPMSPWLTEGRLSDFEILRFFRFNHGRLEATWAQLQTSAAWRHAYKVDAILGESEEWESFAEAKRELFWMGNDSEGLPTLCLRGVHHHPGVLDPSKFMRYLVYLVEKGRREWGVGSHYQANMVVDRVDSGLHNQDPELLKVMLPIFRDNYPEIIHRAYIAPSNWVFMLIWAVARVLVDARQRARVQSAAVFMC
ncbi:hypothetical protein JKP88DRAFT_346597 [Tribonema minus]|uniref:CRAL-TRIO domain-containing protein n=1 Tax=Tribonema minus TaxID=303371 RepID=A0A835Z1B7_9STRA|nr:hypothetical protein JKP88DRAFT_346597 [Tribonema minus]